MQQITKDFIQFIFEKPDISRINHEFGWDKCAVGSFARSVDRSVDGSYEIRRELLKALRIDSPHLYQFLNGGYGFSARVARTLDTIIANFPAGPEQDAFIERLFTYNEDGNRVPHPDTATNNYRQLKRAITVFFPELLVK